MRLEMVTVYLSPEQARALRELKQRTHVSASEHIRQALDGWLPKKRAELERQQQGEPASLDRTLRAVAGVAS